MKPAFAPFLLMLLSSLTIHAATPSPLPLVKTNQPPPARRWSASVLSPEIQSDRRVTFRLRAPKANAVAVSGQWATNQTSMTKETNDVWSVTIGPIEPGVYEYSFIVDSLTMIDPGNPAIKPMREPCTSILHLAGNPPLLPDFQDVPHGVVHQHSYQSKALGRRRDLFVYTPPGYGAKTRTRYPTLYLFHGAGDNHATWVTHGKAHWILDNLIQLGRAKPMLVVMMDGHAAVRSDSGGFDANTVAIEGELMQDVLPLIESNYRVHKDAANRAIVGLSMGGGQSLTIGLNQRDVFAWVGGFSAAPPSKERIEKALQDRQLNKKLKLLWIGCGKDDFLLKRNEEFIAMLQEHNVRHTWELTSGGHSWPIWRGYLAEFVPLLFTSASARTSRRQESPDFLTANLR